MTATMKQAVNTFRRGHEWTAAVVSGQVVVTWDDGIQANVWEDGDGVFHAVDVTQ